MAKGLDRVYIYRISWLQLVFFLSLEGQERLRGVLSRFLAFMEVLKKDALCSMRGASSKLQLLALGFQEGRSSPPNGRKGRFMEGSANPQNGSLCSVDAFMTARDVAYAHCSLPVSGTPYKIWFELSKACSS